MASMQVAIHAYTYRKWILPDWCGSPNQKACWRTLCWNHLMNQLDGLGYIQ